MIAKEEILKDLYKEESAYIQMVQNRVQKHYLDRCFVLKLVNKIYDSKEL